jgi:hypothetical protein
MAQAVDFPERNDHIGRPPTMTDNQCYGLPVCRIITQIPGPTDQEPSQSQLAHISCWELSDREREEIARTGKVYVKILGASLSPMSIHGMKPIYTGTAKDSDVILTEDQIKWLKGERPAPAEEKPQQI